MDDFWRLLSFPWVFRYDWRDGLGGDAGANRFSWSLAGLVRDRDDRLSGFLFGGDGKARKTKVLVPESVACGSRAMA